MGGYESSLQPGLLIKERYLVEKELGRGGFALTYIARDQQLHGRRVVIKLLLENCGGGSWSENKFHLELQALSRIDHPGVVAPLDSGRLAQGSPYLVMQFVDGRTLRTLMSEGLVPLDRAAEIIRQTGQALAAVNAHNVYHRDLKPDNVMVQMLENGGLSVRLIDFGIASVLDGASGTSVRTQVVGSLHYMAPEQLEGQATRTTDIYALAVVAYELVTGVRPFPAEHPVELSKLQRAGVRVAPHKLRPGLARKAEELILRGLALDPASRPPDAGVWAEELARALAGPASGARSYRSLSLLLGAAGVLAAGLVVGVMYFAQSPHPPNSAPSPVRQVSPVPDRRLTLSLVLRGQGAGLRRVDAVRAILARGETFRIEITASTDGHLYVFSEEAAGTEPLNVLFPSPTTNAGSSLVAAARRFQIPEQSWFGFGPNAGRERLWLVWAAHANPMLENAQRWANPRDRGEIGDAAARDAIRALLHGPHAEWRAESGRLELQAGADPVVALIEIEH